MEALLPVLRALIDAAFSAGGITDLVHRDLHARLDAVDPAAAEAARAEQAAADAAAAEAADRAQFEAWKASRAGTESAGFGG